MSNQEGAGPIKFLAFFVPIAGLIFYLMWKDERPVAAKEMGKWGIIGFGVSFALGILAVILQIVLIPLMFI